MADSPGGNAAAQDAAYSGTIAVPDRHRVDAQALSAWLRDRVPGFSGPLAIELFKGGQSNPTYRLSTPRAAYVMRAKPGPVAKLLPSAHAIIAVSMKREQRRHRDIVEAIERHGHPPGWQP